MTNSPAAAANAVGGSQAPGMSGDSSQTDTGSTTAAVMDASET